MGTILPGCEMPSKILKVHIVLFSEVFGVLAVAHVLLGVYIKALCVAGKPDRRDDGAAVLAVVHGIPIDAAEKGVFPYALRAALHIT